MQVVCCCLWLLHAGHSIVRDKQLIFSQSSVNLLKFTAVVKFYDSRKVIQNIGILVLPLLEQSYSTNLIRLYLPGTEIKCRILKYSHTNFELGCL